MSLATLLPERAGKIPGTPSFTSSVDSVIPDIVRKVFVRPDGIGAQVVGVIYATPEEGSTLLCASLAHLLGELHGKVLAVNARELLLAASDRRTLEDHFTKIGASSVWALSAPLDTASRERQVPDFDIAFSNIRDQFDFVVIDGGAFFDLSRAETMARHIDGFLVIVKEGRTAFRDLVDVRDRIQKSGGRILGSVYCATTGSAMAGVR